MRKLTNFAWYEWLATGFGIGMSKVFPGTLGSLWAAFIFYYASLYSSSSLIVILSFILITLISYPTILLTEKKWRKHDSGHIVIDEVSGLLLVYCFFQYSLTSLVAGFVLFRIFDIFKFGPVKWADKNLAGAWGTLVDDLVAGAFAAICLYVLLKFI